MGRCRGPREWACCVGLVLRGGDCVCLEGTMHWVQAVRCVPAGHGRILSGGCICKDVTMRLYWAVSMNCWPLNSAWTGIKHVASVGSQAVPAPYLLLPQHDAAMRAERRAKCGLRSEQSSAFTRMVSSSCMHLQGCHIKTAKSQIELSLLISHLCAGRFSSGLGSRSGVFVCRRRRPQPARVWRACCRACI